VFFTGGGFSLIIRIKAEREMCMGSSETGPRQRSLRLRIVLSVVLLVALGAILFVISLLQRPPAIASGTPSGELAYAANPAGNWDLYLLDPAGTARRLTDDPAGDYFPSWAFDSAMLNFLTGRTGEMGPAQVEPDGSGARALSLMDAVTVVIFEGRLDWDPRWSADGGQLAFTSLRDFNLEVYAMDADGANVRRLTTTPARDWFPAWSPDGTRLAFGSDREGNEDVFVVDADGANLRRLTDNPADDLYPMWSLDGTRIAFVTERERALVDNALDVFVMNPDGTAQRRLEPGEVFEGGLVRAPGGEQLVFVSNREGRWQLYALDAACAATPTDCPDGVRRLTSDDADHLFPVWRP
jgi:Tol biopolymer transport system component